MVDIRPYAKAVVGFVAPAATLIIAAVTTASPGGEQITAATPITAATLQHIEDGIAAATRPPLRYPSSYRRVSGVWRPA